jgi:hypothetical protein
MGYHIDLIDAKFKISKKNNLSKSIVNKLKKFFLDKANIHGGGYSGDNGVEYSWVDNKDIRESQTLGELIEAFRYKPNYKDNGSIDGISFNGSKLGDDRFFFSIIAPYVEKGSFLSYQGDDGCLWKWVFNDKKMEEKTGRITYK